MQNTTERQDKTANSAQGYNRQHDMQGGQDGSPTVFVTIAVIMLLWSYLWLKGNPFLTSRQTVKVMFNGVAMLADHAAVYTDGLKIGQVEKLDYQGQNQVVVTLSIDKSRITLPRGTNFSILTNGIVGAKYVDVTLPKNANMLSKDYEIKPNEVVMGEEPVRPELAINKLVLGLSRLDPEQLGKNYEADRARLVKAADQLAILGEKSMPLVDKGLVLADDVGALSKQMTKTSKALNKIMDNPNFSKDLKQVSASLSKTADTISHTMDQLNVTLQDKPLRDDILKSLKSLQSITNRLDTTVARTQTMANDTVLRKDLKDIVAQTEHIVGRVDTLLSDPKYGGDLRDTIGQAREATANMTVISTQLKQILNKRAPLLHMMFGRPGKIKTEVNAVKKEKEKEKENKDKTENKIKSESQVESESKTEDEAPAVVPAR